MLGSRTQIRTRSSYTMKNALRFKDVFDKAIANWKDGSVRDKDLFIFFSEVAMNPYTLQQRLNDALRWLIDNADTLDKNFKTNEARDYAMLRGLIRFRFELDKVRVGFMSFGKIAFNEGPKNAIDWKSKLTSFLISEEKLFRLDGIMLGDDDIAYINKLIPTGVEKFVTRESITIIK